MLFSFFVLSGCKGVGPFRLETESKVLRLHLPRVSFCQKGACLTVFQVVVVWKRQRFVNSNGSLIFLCKGRCKDDILL